MKKPKQEVLNHVIAFHGITGQATYPIYDVYNAIKGTHIKYGSPWCAMFLWFAMNDQVDDFPCQAGCDAMKNDFKRQKRWYTIKEHEPNVGDVIFFSNRNTEKDCTHVGLVMMVDRETKILVTYEGNTSNMVAPRMYDYGNNSYIVGYADLQDRYSS